MKFHDTLGGPLAQRLAWTLLHFLWQGLLIGAGRGGGRLVFFAFANPRPLRGRHDRASVDGLLYPLVTFAVLQVPAFRIPWPWPRRPDLLAGNPQVPSDSA